MSNEVVFNINNGVLTGGSFREATHVEIPAGVTAIAPPFVNHTGGVFTHHLNLESVTLPEGVEEIGNRTFSACANLKEVRLPSTLKKIGSSAFLGCSSLKSIVIPDGVSVIEGNTFADCTALEQVQLPTSLTTIESAAFANCPKLHKLDFPTGLKSIGAQAFRFCGGLKEITGLPPSAKLEEGVFVECPGLADEEGFVIANHILYGYFGSKTEVTIPPGVTEISTNAFLDRTTITGVTIPATVKKILWRAFSGCTGLTALEIPEGVESVSGFSKCSGLTSIKLPSTVKELGNAVFQECTSLKEVYLPDGLTDISMSAFNLCTALTNVRLPAKLKYIRSGAFNDCTALEEIQIPNSVEIMEGFCNCSSLKKINMPKSLRVANGGAFQGSKKIPYLRILPSTGGGWYAFPKEILLLLENPFPEVGKIEHSDFNRGSTFLATVGDPLEGGFRLVINDKMTKLKVFDKKGTLNWKIYDHILSGNEGKLASALQTFAMLCRLRWPLELEDSTKELYTENICKNIKKIAPYANANPTDGLVALLEEIGALTAKNKKSLLPLMGIGEAAAPKKKAEKAPAESGVKTPAQLKKEWNLKKLDDGTLRLTSYKGSDTEVVVPNLIGKDPVTVIGNECMCCNNFCRATPEQLSLRKRITSLVIPEGITEIGEDAFYGCEKLESVTLPSTLKTIGKRAFLGCTNLKNINLPQGVALDTAVFQHCDGLADEQGLVIQGNILYKCCKGGDIVVPAHVKQVESIAFSHLPELKSVVFPEGLTKLPSNLFRVCPALEQVTIPASVTGLSYNVFADRKAIRVCGYTGSAAEEYCRTNGMLQFISLGVAEKPEASEFDIQDGVLIRYNGKAKEVRIPEGVKTIAAYRTSGISWSRGGAFESNKHIESVIIPEGVESIIGDAFARCPNLKQIQFPTTLVNTEKDCFRNTPWLENHPMGPVYAGKVLIGYNGPDRAQVQAENIREELIVEPGIVTIGNMACWGAASLVKIVLPEGLQRICDEAFGYCSRLEEIVAPQSLTELGDYCFQDVPALKRGSGGVLHKTTKLPAKFKIFYTGNPEDTAWLALYQQDASWRKAIQGKLESNPEIISPTLEKMAELINAMEPLDKSVGNRAGNFLLEVYKSAESAPLKAVYQALKDKKHPAVKKLDADEDFQKALDGAPLEDLSQLHPVEAMVLENLKATPAFEKLVSRIAAGIPYAGSDEICAPRVLAFVAYEYIRQYDPESTKHVSTYFSACTAYDLSPKADEVAAALDRQQLLSALLLLAEQYGSEYWLPYARYADDKRTVALLSRMRDWDNWNLFGATGRKHIIIARSGLLLNDTKAAMIHMDQVDCLGLYASLRNTDAETLRDTVLADFGFNENREISYDLGGNTALIRLDKDLNLTIFDTNAGKTVKSIPKKGANAALYEKAKADFSDLKKNIKKVITNRKHLLFQDFLTGGEKTAEKWKQSYLGNPVLNSVARLLVWAQGDRTFVLTLEGAVDASGDPYTITPDPIRVAHPMEMRGEIKAWQNYFTAQGLKQPFEQIWEPAYTPEQIDPDRYTGTSLNVYRLVNKEAHGIHVWGLRDYSEDYGFQLTDCAMEQDASEWRFIHGVTEDATFRLGKFTFQKFTRYVNHIVYLFDKWTITERLLKDDTSVAGMLEAFTPAQIREFINLTAEHSCVNCSAMLLNFQSSHFEAIDPTAEFTLDL